MTQETRCETPRASPRHPDRRRREVHCGTDALSPAQKNASAVRIPTRHYALKGRVLGRPLSTMSAARTFSLNRSRSAGLKALTRAWGSSSMKSVEPRQSKTWPRRVLQHVHRLALVSICSARRRASGSDSTLSVSSAFRPRGGSSFAFFRRSNLRIGLMHEARSIGRAVPSPRRDGR
jgi:hypothetical protein